MKTILTIATIITIASALTLFGCLICGIWMDELEIVKKVAMTSIAFLAFGFITGLIATTIVEDHQL